MKAVPLMPDQDYQWLTDETWRKTNDAIFESLIAGPGHDQPAKISGDTATK